jgi:hypothetical protein
VSDEQILRYLQNHGLLCIEHALCSAGAETCLPLSRNAGKLVEQVPDIFLLGGMSAMEGTEQATPSGGPKKAVSAWHLKIEMRDGGTLDA